MTLTAAGEAKGPPQSGDREGKDGECGDREDAGRVREGTAGPWVDAVLLAARHLGVAVSPELVRNSSAWAGRPDSGQAIIDIALSAGFPALLSKSRCMNFPRSCSLPWLQSAIRIPASSPE